MGSYNKTLVSTFATAGVEGFLDGVFVVLCLTALYLLIHRSPNRRSKRPNFWLNLAHPMVLGSVLLLFFIIGHWICTMIRVFTAVSLISRGESAQAYLESVSSPTIFSGAVFIVCSIATADFLLIWRLWIVSEHKWWIIVPPVLTDLGFIVCGLRASVWFAGQQSNGETLYSSAVAAWLQGGALLTLTTNVYCSAGLMAYIYRIQNMTFFSDKTALKSVITIVTESALVWSLWSICVLINYYQQSFLSLLTFDCCPAMSGIAFMLINVRVGLGWDISPYSANHQQTTYSVTLPTFKAVSLSRSSSQRSQAAVDWPYSHRGGLGVNSGDDRVPASPEDLEKQGLPTSDSEDRKALGYLHY